MCIRVCLCLPLYIFHYFIVVCMCICIHVNFAITCQLIEKCVQLIAITCISKRIDWIKRKSYHSRICRLSHVLVYYINEYILAILILHKLLVLASEVRVTREIL